MDESTVRTRAEEHAKAVQEGNMRRAAEDLNADARAQAGEVMKAVPKPVTSISVVSVEASGDDYLAVIRYGGADSEALVESRWTEEGGRTVIGNLRLL